MGQTITLYRPVGSAELKLIEALHWRAFPPRLPEQPIFYPVTNQAYAEQIARDWNAVHNDDRKGFVLAFDVQRVVADRYERQIVGGQEHEELWVPAEELDTFNEAIVGDIRVVSSFEGAT